MFGKSSLTNSSKPTLDATTLQDLVLTLDEVTAELLSAGSSPTAGNVTLIANNNISTKKFEEGAGKNLLAHELTHIVGYRIV